MQVVFIPDFFIPDIFKPDVCTIVFIQDFF